MIAIAGTWGRKFGVVGAIVLMMVLTACGTTQQPRVEDAQKAAPSRGKEAFYERQMISDIEYITDQVGQLYFVYHISASGTLVDQVVCKGRPTSSTESLEPNTARYLPYPNSDASDGRLFLFKLGTNDDGTEIMAGTEEQMGRDGTYGEPVPFRQCITPTNMYHDFPPESGAIATLVYDEPRTFTNGTAQINTELAAKTVQAQAVIARGGCVDTQLNEIKCERTLPAPGADPVPAPPQVSPIQP